jgi:hypothetical protein
LPHQAAEQLDTSCGTLRPALYPTLRPLPVADSRGAAQVGSLPGALPALLDLVAAWQPHGRAEPPDPRAPDPRPPDPGAAPGEVAAAAARCLAQLSVHERLRPRLAAAGALPVLCAAALRAGGLAAPARPAAADGGGGGGGGGNNGGGRDHSSRTNGSGDGGGAQGARPGAAASCGVSEGGGGGQGGERQPSESEPGAAGRQDAADACRGGGVGAEWTPRQAPKAAPGAAHAMGLALQRAAAAAVANLCGDAALAARAAEDGVAARALVALAASPDLDVQVGKGVGTGLVLGWYKARPRTAAASARWSRWRPRPTSTCRWGSGAGWEGVRQGVGEPCWSLRLSGRVRSSAQPKFLEEHVFRD